MVTVCSAKQKSYRKFIMLLILIGFTACIIYYVYALNNYIPDTININSNSVSRFDLNVPFIGTIKQDESLEVSVNLMDYFEIKTTECGNYVFDFKLFGFIPFKKVNVNVCDEVMIIPCGIPVGIYIKTEGIMVVDIGDINCTQGVYSSPALDLIWPGDYIVSVGDKNVYTKEDLIHEINNLDNYNDDYIILNVNRNGNYIDVRIKPVTDDDGTKKIGAWVRDDCHGLGTLTYIDSEGEFGALGHGISDIDTGKLVLSHEGYLYGAKIWSIIKGKAGKPGEVVGSIYYEPDYFLGRIYENSNKGIYGKSDNNLFKYIDSYQMPIGYKQDIKVGKAYIKSFVDGQIKDYEINISSVDISNTNVNKGIMFVVTDKELLSNTGGIIQGMSGSPIIQDGKVIGAVTHVLVNDSSRGYGIFIETMLAHDL